MDEMLQQASAAVLQNPRQLAEHMVHVHSQASEAFGRMRAEGHEVSYERVWETLRCMMRKVSAALTDHDAACYLLHEGFRTAHLYAQTGDPAIYDVHEMLLLESERRASALPADGPYARLCEACGDWLANRAHTDPLPPCVLAKNACTQWPLPTIAE